MPRRSLLCEQRLKDLGVLGSFIHREEYSLDLIPFDGDLLSMESEGAFKVSFTFSFLTSDFNFGHIYEHDNISDIVLICIFVITVKLSLSPCLLTFKIFLFSKLLAHFCCLFFFL